ncbi:hypothetical protein JTB14_018884 [Gonioctena quinquepunctata]|nr:hypothetical protein JTB14_018884 [Gonioctena quinquepunctata]
MCVPGLTTNLLSVGKLINNGNKVNFEENCCKIYNKHNELVAMADLINNVYEMRVKKEHQCMLSSTTSASSGIWHRRLGHINYKDLFKMQAGAVEGMTFKTKRDSTNKCIVCCEGKQSWHPFKHQGTRATSLLELVHADVCVIRPVYGVL